MEQKNEPGKLKEPEYYLDIRNGSLLFITWEQNRPAENYWVKLEEEAYENLAGSMTANRGLKVEDASFVLVFQEYNSGDCFNHNCLVVFPKDFSNEEIDKVLDLGEVAKHDHMNLVWYRNFSLKTLQDMD